jgi:hypothetical protein
MTTPTKPLIYLASPYSHFLIRVERERHFAVLNCAARLIGEGNVVFSPIVHCHPIKELMRGCGDWDTWKEYNKTFLDHCEEMIVLMLTGWEESVGVKAEIEYTKALNKPISYILS